MRHFIIIAFLCLSLSSNTLAQESAPDNKTPVEKEPLEAAEENFKKYPTRLPNNIPRTHFPPNEDKSMSLLASKLPEDARLWLNTEHGRFLSIWQKDRSGNPKGALLIIHAEGEHPAWPSTTQPLHATLPDYGWATLAVSLPAPDLLSPPKRTAPVKSFISINNTLAETKAINKQSMDKKTKKTQTQEEEEKEKEEKAAQNSETMPSPTELPDQVEKIPAERIAERRLESTLRFLHDSGQFNVILLGNGSGAIRASNFLNKILPKVNNPKLREKLEKPVRAIIIVNGRNQLPSMEKGYQHWFIDPEIPVLDIFTNMDDRNSKEAKDRKIIARQKKLAIYKQVKLNRLTHENSWGENRLSKRIRSFLDSNAAGVEVKNAKIR